jgi:hypothetical protein
MALKQLNTVWTQGSYEADQRFIIKKAENLSARLDAHFDGGNSIAIGYGYDLLLHSASQVAAALEL